MIARVWLMRLWLHQSGWEERLRLLAWVLLTALFITTVLQAMPFAGELQRCIQRLGGH